ncbi:sialidase family protein [Pedobacter frigiditerrae]|uniref:sialidase family protein n=1 Tax=Pedobacter frigiditerrae TaxID=2530452 RepID=UPI00292FE1D7|nr:sialidase family protein [Pedobacter frigiditerrae]
MNIFLNRFAILMIGLIGVFSIKSSFAQSSVTIPLNFIYKPGDGGYACFRIPTLLTTSKNVMLAFAEARKLNCGDAGDIDIVLRRSIDGGKNWSELQVVRSDSTNTCGNPVPILDKTNGRILLVTSWNLGTDHEKQIMDLSSQKGRQVYVQHSDNDGKTWTSAKEITSSVKMNNWTWYATGPCHGLQIANGQYKGRLVVPVNHVEMPAKKNFANIIYSDDHGDTWKLGNNTPQDQMNETTVAEIGNGRLMLNMRNADRTIKQRHTSISNDGGQTWSDVRRDSTLVEPICQGSLLNSAIGKKPVLFFINPAHKTKRMNLTLRTSFDEGTSWANAKVIHTGPAAYSDITTYKNKELGILYEAGIEKPYEGIVFQLINLKEAIKP